jgi:ABC-type sugar transport system permease subunit
MAKKKASYEVKQSRVGYWFVLPFVIGAIVFVVWPLIQSVIFSLNDITLSTEWGKGLVTVDNTFGFQHYNQLLTESDTFRRQLLDSLKDMGINVPIVVIFSFFMASVLNTKFLGRGVARSIMFLPVIISAGMVVFLSNGDLVTSLQSAGDRFASTADSATVDVTTAFESMLMGMDLSPALVDFLIGSVNRISTITQMGAVSIVIFLAGLQSISPSIYEASYIEGATKWEVFWKISLPMVSPMILLSVIYTIIESFTSQSNVVMSEITKNIQSANYDTASAMAVIYSFIILVIMGVCYAVISRLVFYYD